jgi:hypothetical protein
VSDPAGADAASSLAAMISTAPDGNTLRLALIDRAKAGGASWAQIGAVLGISGREAKRNTHKLRRGVRAAPEPGSE